MKSLLLGPMFLAVWTIGLILIAMGFSHHDTRACPAKISPLDAAQGKVICPSPSTSIYPKQVK